MEKTTNAGGFMCCRNCHNNPENNPYASGICCCVLPTMEMQRSPGSPERSWTVTTTTTTYALNLKSYHDQ